MMKYILTFLIFLLFRVVLVAQGTPNIVLVGYIYESNNRGYINAVTVKITSSDQKHRFEVTTNRQGKFEVKIPITGGVYNIEAQKPAYKRAFTKITTKGRIANEGIFTKVEMSRLPGYILDMSLTDLVDPDNPGAPAYGVEGTRIEIYNNTLQEEIINIAKHPTHMIQCNLEQGNEYIFLIRKEGYYTKRMRANVNVNGCILCMEGFGTVTPSVTENLTKENTRGTLGANVKLKKMVLNEKMKMDNIYYDLGKATLRPEAYAPLDELAKMMYDNPQIVVELSAHTDCRGKAQTNLELSQRRANAVVNYIKSKVKLKPNQIEAKGYGETQPLNSCVDGVDCLEELHQQNRRTELTVIDILAEDPSKVRSLASMMQERNFDLILNANNEAYAESGAKTELYHRKTPSKPQTMELNYTGYKLQMLDKEGDLSTNHFMFYEFDQVFLDVLKERHYAFLIGDYKDYNEAQEVLKKYQKQFPRAKVVAYKDGVRVQE
ncbi:OmpA family protein [Aureispira anguillae]|uniref:OmpA family protein n=1 Tax=Aureispira anguillae TaxID=2864201 RepID=A0A915VKK5_9BACT|nr:OmpA family protein [Aureispira anguillae]BDS09731.1 OmpA family protein [Aureispira anguillae]